MASMTANFANPFDSPHPAPVPPDLIALRAAGPVAAAPVDGAGRLGDPPPVLSCSRPSRNRPTCWRRASCWSRRSAGRRSCSPFYFAISARLMMVIAASWPFTILAGFLTGQLETGARLRVGRLRLSVARPPGHVASGAVIGVGRGCWCGGRDDGGVWGAALLVPGTAEYGGDVAIHWAQVSNWGPIMGVLAVAKSGIVIARRPWLFVGAVVVAGLLAAGIGRLICLRTRPALGTSPALQRPSSMATYAPHPARAGSDGRSGPIVDARRSQSRIRPRPDAAPATRAVRVSRP